FKNKKAASFGTYGWHDVSSKIIQDGLKEAGFELILEPISANWRPDKPLQDQCVEYGKKFAALTR
ncbi:MAG: anaerobic nitric oxide reductase flavorubredoxin, partial [Bacteroidota bacterium]|nr:anaerobic nitric oxide reductase flavorubredoxin [Bacteroidota bacterium]